MYSGWVYQNTVYPRDNFSTTSSVFILVYDTTRSVPISVYRKFSTFILVYHKFSADFSIPQVQYRFQYTWAHLISLYPDFMSSVYPDFSIPSFSMPRFHEFSIPWFHESVYPDFSIPGFSILRFQICAAGGFFWCILMVYRKICARIFVGILGVYWIKFSVLTGWRENGHTLTGLSVSRALTAILFGLRRPHGARLVLVSQS